MYERNIHDCLRMCPHQDGTHNLGMCSDGNRNCSPSVYRRMFHRVSHTSQSGRFIHHITQGLCLRLLQDRSVTCILPSSPSLAR